MRKEVREEVREDDIKITIDIMKELKASRNLVADKLKEKFFLTPEHVEEKLSKYW